MKDLFQRIFLSTDPENEDLKKPSGGIRGITPVDIWRRVTGRTIVQVTPPKHVSS